MTIDQFLVKLRHHTARKKVQWSILGGVLIRHGHSCPITVFNDRPAWSFLTEADKLGLDAVDAHEIIKAADSRAPYSHELQTKLFKACGLQDNG